MTGPKIVWIFMAEGLRSGTKCTYFVPLTPSPPPPPELNRNQQRCIRYASGTYKKEIEGLE
jgi:hypothetical protein